VSVVIENLSGTVAIIGSVNLVNISEIIFKQGDNVVHTINSNDLPGINANDNTWALANNNTWTSKLTQGELSSPIPFQTTEIDKPTAFTDTVISCSV
jgi:hypothetical protein